LKSREREQNIGEKERKGIGRVSIEQRI